MTIKTQPQPAFSVTTKSEALTTWPDYSLIFVEDENILYQLRSSVLTRVSGYQSAWIDGTFRTKLQPFFKMVTTNSSGVATRYLTDNGLATGNALYADVYLSTGDIRLADTGATYARGDFTLSTDKKTLTINVSKQAFTGVTVLGTSVLGSVAMVNAASVNAYLYILGD